MFSNDDIAAYYNTTQQHYERWWKLKSNLSLHYGIWSDGVRTFKDSLENTNRVLLAHSGIKKEHHVLDAGCGVGGAAFFIHKQTGAEITGISLSKKQIDLAKSEAIKRRIDHKVSFRQIDFTNTDYPAASFNVVWACESVCHTMDKSDFITECFRLLKPSGRLVLCDFFTSHSQLRDTDDLLGKWARTWGVPSFANPEDFSASLLRAGFVNIEEFDYTKEIKKSARRLHMASIVGAIPSEIYNLFNPNVSEFARSHYKCGYYQYKALKKGLWRYKLLVALKE